MKIELTKKQLSNFLKKIDKKELCWEWNASLTHDFYGRFRTSLKTLLSHRVSYSIFKGEIPEGMCVCHKCDNPKCCNPDHLFLGTVKENSNDMISKGRSLAGSKNHKSKLTENDIKEIVLMRLETGLSYPKIAKIYNVTPSAIRFIFIGKNWKHLILK